MTKILMLDFMHWVFPKNKNSLIELFKECNVEFKYLQPDTVYHNSRTVIASHYHSVPDQYYKGFNLLNMIKVEMVKETGWYKWDKKIEHDYILRLMGLIDWCYKIYNEENPDYIVIEGGLTYFARVCSEVARELGINIICVENSFIDGKIYMDMNNTGFVVNRHSFARNSQDWLDTRCLTKKIEEEVDVIIKNVFNSLKYKTNTVDRLPNFKYEKSVLIPLQVCGDQVCVYDSKYNNEKFMNSIIWLATYKFQDWNVIFRCHPVEERWRGKARTGNWLEKRNLPDNVYVIRGDFNSVSTQELMKKADLIFVNNSQAGLEACLMEKPVIVFGDAFYGNKGFTTAYKKTLNWEKIKNEPEILLNIPQMKLWFYYFYKWLFNKKFTNEDKKRIIKHLNLKG